MAHRGFSEEEDRYIEAHYGRHPCEDIARHLGRSATSIGKRARRLGVAKPIRRWTDEEDEIVRSSVGRKLKDVAGDLGRWEGEVSERARKLGIGSWCRDMRGYARFGGYRTVRIGVRRVVAHRAAMERHLGRRLESREVVHHIDLDKDNNEISNLYLCDGPAAHRKAHASLDAIPADIRERGLARFDRAGGVYVICETED